MTKKLYEDRAAKAQQMKDLLNAAKTANRDLTDEEKATFDALKVEIENIDREIAVEDIGLKPVPAEKETDEVKAFENFIRGIVNADEPTTKSTAGVMIPTTVWDRIISRVTEICPIYESADVYNMAGNLTIPIYNEGSSTISMDYVTEGTEPDSGKAVISSITLTGFLAGCLARISNSLINNTNFDIVGFVVAKMSQAIAEWIEGELLSGTSQKIEGLSGIKADMTVTTASATAITADELIDAQDLVVDNYQRDAYWIMNRKTRNALRKLKDKDGNYLLNRDLTARWGYELLGKDVYCSDNMAQLGADNVVVFYGDYSGLAVKVSEEAEIEVLHERYAAQHETGVVAFVEMDAKIADVQKIAQIVCGGGTSV